MSSKRLETSQSIDGLFLLFLVFLTLKLCEVIDWSWWWVTVPLWGGVALCLAAMALAIIVGLTIAAFVGIWVLIKEWRS